MELASFRTYNLISISITCPLQLVHGFLGLLKMRPDLTQRTKNSTFEA